MKGKVIMYDFFVSHSSEDKNSIVQPIVQKLINMGYSVWYDENEIVAGDRIISDIKTGLNQSYCLVLILTDSFAEKTWTLYETAFFNSISKRAIIPVKYAISSENYNKIAGFLGDIRYVDAARKEPSAIINDLINALVKIKNENKDLECLDKLKKLHHKIASYETSSTSCISINLNHYFDLIEQNYDFDFIILSAKKVVSEIVYALLEYKNYIVSPCERNNDSILDLINRNDIGSNNFREHVNFIFTLSTDTLNGQIQLINNALAIIIEYYCSTRYPISSTKSNFQVVYPEELKYEDFVEMYEIDKKVMREDLIASVDTAYGWYKYNSYTHIAVKDMSMQRIIGYFALLPVNEHTYNKIMCGDFQDKDFNEDNIEQFIFSDFYKVYIAGVGIDPNYQNTSAFIKLYNALIDLFVYLAKEREVYISEVIAEASTKQGEKFCKMVGMTKVTSTISCTDVYELVTIPPKFRLNNKKGKELFDLCQKKYEEFREYFPG